MGGYGGSGANGLTIKLVDDLPISLPFRQVRINYHISLNNSRGDYFFFCTKRGRLFKGR